MRNTSDYPTIDVQGPLARALQDRGYTVVDDPGTAHFQLQGNVLQANQDVTYAVTINLQLSERPQRGAVVRQRTNTFRGSSSGSFGAAVSESTPYSSTVSMSSSGNSNQRSQSVDETSAFKRYNVRDIAYANQVNLQLEQAVPILVDRLASSFANLFE